MRRVLVLVVLIVVGLVVALAWRLHRQDAEKDVPSGGTGTVEGVELDVVSKHAARIRAIHANEGDAVKAGQLLVELDCEEALAVHAEATARLRVAEAAIVTAEQSARAARHGAKGARAAAQAARHLAESARETVAASRAAEAAAAAQRGALTSEHRVAARQQARIERLRKAEARTESDLDVATARAQALEFQVRSAGANVRAAQARTSSATGSANAARAQAEAAGAQSRAALAQARGASAQIEVARRNLEVARAALRRAEIAVGECRLVAPRSAVVLTRHREPGELALPGTRILTLVDASDLRTTFYIPNAELAHAAPGRAVEIVADAYRGRVFPGKILSVSPKAEFTPRNIQTREDRDRLVYAVKVAVANPDGSLRPGMPVEVRIPGSKRVR